MFEERIRERFERGEIRYPVHLSNCPVEIDYREGDWIFSTHRNHLHALYVFSEGELEEWIVKNGSMHVYKERFFTSGIVGGNLPIALGVALSIKRNRGKERVWCFTGDMASNTGIYHECLRYASGWDLPVTFIVENNTYSVNTPTREAWGVKAKNKEKFVYYKRKYPHQGSGVKVIF